MDISNNDNACYHWVEFRYNLLGQTGPKYVICLFYLDFLSRAI